MAELERARGAVADAWLIERSDGTQEVVLSPLTDDTFMDEGDEAHALYRASPPAQDSAAQASPMGVPSDTELAPAEPSAAGVEPAVIDLTDYGFGLCVSKKDYDHLWDCYKLLHYAEQQVTARLRRRIERNETLQRRTLLMSANAPLTKLLRDAHECLQQAIQQIPTTQLVQQSDWQDRAVTVLEQLEAAAELERARGAVTLSSEEIRIVRRALSMYHNACYGRANEIAQDRNNRLGLPSEAVGMAIDEADAAGKILVQLAASPPERQDSPFPNCKYRMCDLPGQCLSEGKCHHPRQDSAAPVTPANHAHAVPECAREPSPAEPSAAGPEELSRRVSHAISAMPSWAEGKAWTGVVVELLTSLTARLREMGEQQCHHGWRGHAPKDGRRIVTPCPACGSHSLFIGEGGHLTCAVLGSDHGPYNGCPEPSVEDAVNNLKQRLAQAERDREALREDAELLDWLEKNYHASEVDEYAAQGNARWVFSTPLLGSWAPLRARLRAALSASPGARE